MHTETWTHSYTFGRSLARISKGEAFNTRDYFVAGAFLLFSITYLHV